MFHHYLDSDQARHEQWFDTRWSVLGPSLTPVRSICGIKVLPWRTYGDPADFDYIVNIGGLRPVTDPDPETLDFLRTAARHRTVLVGSARAAS